ncbi:MAG TPA: hypothetical protein VGL97_15440 [Bryobacteraceae bacterium]
MQSAALFFFRYIMIAAAMAGALYSGLLARADWLFHLDTATSVPAAVHLVPYNSAYLARLASWEPEERNQLLHRAVELNPYDYESWIQLGLLSEMRQGDAKAAESDYLRAAAVNHMFLPKWTLTNFYFRQQNATEFFHWANATLQITPYSSDPIFAQMWLMSQDAGKLAAVIPDRPRILLQYAWYLSNNHQFGAIPQTLQRLIAAVGEDNPRDWGRDDLIASMVDRILADGDPHDALQVWSVLKDAGWIRQRVPDSNRPLTNGDFHIPFFRHGFDWVPVDSAGVRVEQFPDEPVARITLSGDQPDHCVVLQQYVPIEAGAAYHLQWQVKAQNLTGESGLAWHLHPVQIKTTGDLVSGDLLASPFAWKFRPSFAPPGFLLSLEYTRPLGHTRAAGVAMLQNVSLIRQP